MTNIRDLMTTDDTLEMEGLYDEVIRQHNEQEEEVAAGFREAERRAFDWEIDLPPDFFIW